MSKRKAPRKAIQRRDPPARRPTASDAETLKAKHQLDAGYDFRTELRRELELFEMWESLYANGDVKPPGEARRNLAGFQKRCATWRASAAELRLMEMTLLDMHFEGNLQDSLQVAERELRALGDAATAGLARIRGRKGKPKGPRGKDSLYHGLVRIWGAASGRPFDVRHVRHTETKWPRPLEPYEDIFGENYTGDTFHFVIECLDLLGIEYESPGAVGRALQRLQPT